MSYELFPTIHGPDHTEVIVKLPPCHWEAPLGLNASTTKLFWNQPENKRHFEDTVNPISGVVDIFRDAAITTSIGGSPNGTHYINYRGKPIRPCAQPQYQTLMYMSGHEIEYFQHFLDNGIPHVSLMQFATDIDPSEVTFVLDTWNSDSIPYLLRRYGMKEVVRYERGISAHKIILPRIVPVIHTYLTQNFIDRLDLRHDRMSKVVLVSRTAQDGVKQSRIIDNQHALEEELRAQFGDAFVVLKTKEVSIENAIALVQQAVMVIGSHGGGMYHALWASRKAVVVELMPICQYGTYPMQGQVSRMPPFAHLAIYTNSMMNGQKFYRWYEVACEANYKVTVAELVKWLGRIDLPGRVHR
jgi:hypothetical protein